MQNSAISKDIVSALQRYEAAELGLRGLDDDETDARVDKMTNRLRRDLKAVPKPISAAEAAAAFKMLRRELLCELECGGDFYDAMLALAEAVQDYLARAASSSEEARS